MTKFLALLLLTTILTNATSLKLGDCVLSLQLPIWEVSYVGKLTAYDNSVKTYKLQYTTKYENVGVDYLSANFRKVNCSLMSKP